MIGVAQILSKNNELIIQNFISIDPNFYSYFEWTDFIPALVSSEIYDFLKFDKLPRILLKFFRSIFWNIRYKDQNPDNVMKSLSKGNKFV